MPKLPEFGKPSNEWSRGGAGGAQHEFFIKNFKGDITRPVQILDDDPDHWVKYYQHFDYPNKMSYPCAIKAGEDSCIGCSYPSADPDNEKDPGAKVRKVSVQWIMPVLDPQGYIGLYAVGVGLQTDALAKRKLYGDLDKQVWAVVRTANENNDFNSVKWSLSILPGQELRAPKFPVPTTQEIQTILAKKYLRAAGVYGYDVGDDSIDGTASYDPPAADTADEAQATHAPDPVTAERPGDVASEALAARKAQAVEKGVEPTPETDWDTANTDAIRAYLDSKEVEYSSRAPRSVLVGIAKKTAASETAAAL